MTVDFASFLHSLSYMWQGMLGIFIVMIIIALIITGLSKVFKK